MQKIKIKDFFEKILSEIFVDKYNCISCDAELYQSTKYGLCDKCIKSVTFVKDAMCKKCGRLQLNEADYCDTCIEHKREFDFARSCVVYDDVAKEIVRGLKFGGKKYLAKYIANYLVERYQSTFEGVNIDVVIPVPVTKKKKVSRGYNQAWEIAKSFANAVDLTADETIVAKIKDTDEQARLGGAEREENPIGAFEVKDKDKVKDKVILIVDDVMTTGSTASEIARILKKAKAKQVYLLTFASTRYRVEGEEAQEEQDTKGKKKKDKKSARREMQSQESQEQDKVQEDSRESQEQDKGLEDNQEQCREDNQDQQ